jgi:hypothetical protein
MLIAREDNGQQLLGLVEADRKAGKRITGYVYAVLVTNLEYEILSLGQLYRDRADAENTFYGLPSTPELVQGGCGAVDDQIGLAFVLRPSQTNPRRPRFASNASVAAESCEWRGATAGSA